MKILIFLYFILNAVWSYLNIGVFVSKFLSNNAILAYALELPLLAFVVGIISFFGFKKDWGRKVLIYCLVYFTITDMGKYIGTDDFDLSAGSWIYYGFTAMNALMAVLLFKKKI